MCEKDKDLLLKDLCGKLPYGVVVHFEGWNPEKLTQIDLRELVFNDMGGIPKPYLRPMSSMTEEEQKVLKEEQLKDERLFAECLTKCKNGDDSMRGKIIPHFAADWCDKKHFDYRGLIPRGMALEAKEGMYNN